MSETTNLKLFKQDNPTTNTNNFDIEKTLSENWDKLDENAGTTNKKLESLEKVDSTTNETITAIQEEQTTQNENIEKNAEGIAQNKKDVDEELTKIKKENSLLKSQIPTGTASGNNIHLEDSSNMDFEWKLRGESYQKTTQGYNLYNIDEALNDVLKKNGDSSYTFTRTSSRFAKAVNISIPANTDFVIDYSNVKLNGNYEGNILSAIIKYTDDTDTTSSLYSTGEDRRGLRRYSKDIKSIQLYLESSLTEGTSITFSDFMIYLGSNLSKTYEPYTGGAPSPSPDYPSLIESIENNIKITICNKNIFNGFFATNGVWKDDGTINYVIQSKLYWRTDFIKIPNKNIYFSSKQLNIFSSAILLEFDADKKYITSNKIYQINSSLNKVSLNENTRFIAIQWNLQNATEIEGLFADFQIEVGSTASPYISHQEQTIIFPLAEGQKLRSLPNGVKDYLAEDGIHKNVGIIILNGSGGTNESYFKALDNKFQLGLNTKKGLLLKNLKTDNLKISVLSDKFLGVPWNIMKDTIEGWQIALRQDGSYTYLRLLTTGIKDTKALETFLQNNNAIVAYPLATEEIIPYTQEQQAVIDKILYTYKNVTNISVDDELATLDITYKKDIETMFNNQAKEYNERLSNIESLLNTTSTSALLLDNLENDLKEEV